MRELNYKVQIKRFVTDLKSEMIQMLLQLVVILNPRIT